MTGSQCARGDISGSPSVFFYGTQPVGLTWCFASCPAVGYPPGSDTGFGKDCFEMEVGVIVEAKPFGSSLSRYDQPFAYR